MRFRRSVVATLLLSALWSFACGGDPPDKEIQQAQTAIDQARSAGADRYAVEEYNAAVEALKNAHTAVEQHDYRLALNDALDSKERADNSGKLAIEGKAAARSAADRAIASAGGLITAADTKLKAAIAARPTAARGLADARTAMDEAEKQLQDARSAMSGEDYHAALRAASLAAEAAKSATEKIDAAAPPGQPRRRGN